ncbi:MAG: hypothetical protein MI784_09100 [Cytophagales bacterium]|nr:hypothetical protein [Cytophagales bacterium]
MKRNKIFMLLLFVFCWSSCSEEEGISTTDTNSISEVPVFSHMIYDIHDSIDWQLDTMLLNGEAHPYNDAYAGMIMNLNGQQGIQLRKGNETVYGNYDLVYDNLVKVYGLNSFDDMMSNHFNYPDFSNSLSNQSGNLSVGEGWRIRMDSSGQKMYWIASDGAMQAIFSKASH